jgi:integrase
MASELVPHLEDAIERSTSPVGIVRNIRFHDLRHTTGSLLAMAGVDKPALQRILRHRGSAADDVHVRAQPTQLRCRG